MSKMTDKGTYMIEGWDIRKNIIPKLSDEFFDNFVEDKVRGDSDYVKVEGLVALAHEKGYRGKTSDIIQTPSKENGLTAIVKVGVKGIYYDKYTDEIKEGIWEAIGDCSPTSAPNKFIAVHAIRMAETRALGRALRDYLNMAVVCGEEMGGLLEQEEMTTAQRNTIKSLLSSKKIDQEEMQDYLVEVIGRVKLGKDATEGEAQVLIDWLTIQENKEEESKGPSGNDNE